MPEEEEEQRVWQAQGGALGDRIGSVWPGVGPRMLRKDFGLILGGGELYEPCTRAGRFRFAKIFRVRDFPGGPVGKTPHSQCRGPEFDPWSGN